MKCFAYYNTLISWWTIFYTKWHHRPDKCSLVSDKSSLVSIFRCNKYLMIYWKTIQKWIGFLNSNNIKDFLGKWKRVWVFLCCNIQLLKIHTNSEFAIILPSSTETSCFTSGISGTVKGMAAFFLMYLTKASTVRFVSTDNCTLKYISHQQMFYQSKSQYGEGEEVEILLNFEVVHGSEFHSTTKLLMQHNSLLSTLMCVWLMTNCLPVVPCSCCQQGRKVWLGIL